MQRRIIVLSVMVTLVYWLGHAAGCASAGQDQNYKLLEDDRPMFDTSPNRTNHPGESRIPSSPATYIATAPEPAQEVEAALEPAPQTDAPVDKEVDAIRHTLLVEGVEPSVTGLDRSHWPVTVVSPAPVDGPFCSLLWFCWE